MTGSVEQPDGSTPALPNEDRLLMVRVAAREPSAQRELCLRLVARVRRTTRALIRTSDDADDAAQATLLEILRFADSYRGESSLERWADRITVRTALRLARESRRRGMLVDGALGPDDLPGAHHDHEGRELLTSVKRHVDRLAEPRRAVLVLRCIMGYSIDEVSEMTGASPNTVKDRLLRAREEIRQMIRRESAALPLRVANE